MASNDPYVTGKLMERKLNLVDKPKDKMPPRLNNSKVRKRPINHTQGLKLDYTDRFLPRMICVGTHSPFMGIVSRVRKALDNSPAGVHSNSSNKGLPLKARIAALRGPSAPADREVVLIRGSGRAMAKTLDVAAWFTREADVVVNVRTLTLQAVDEVIVDEDGAEEEGGFAREKETQVRMVNCLEIGLRLR